MGIMVGVIPVELVSAGMSTQERGGGGPRGPSIVQTHVQVDFC